MECPVCGCWLWGGTAGAVYAPHFFFLVEAIASTLIVAPNTSTLAGIFLWYCRVPVNMPQLLKLYNEPTISILVNFCFRYGASFGLCGGVSVVPVSVVFSSFEIVPWNGYNHGYYKCYPCLYDISVHLPFIFVFRKATDHISHPD